MDYKLKIIETTLLDILGNPVTHMIFDYLDNRCNLKKDEIPAKMDEFEKQLETLLGNAAQRIIDVIEERWNNNK